MVGKRNKSLGCVLLLLLTVVSLWTAIASAQEITAPEYKVKAAFLYNFAKLAEWPSNTFATATSPIVIGVLGKDPFNSQLEQITRDKSVDGRPIVITHYDRVDEIHGCHILFISASENSRLSSILSQLENQPLLTVGDTAHFIHLGGAVRLIKREAEIRFQINLDAVNRRGIKLSSKLLRLAEIVRSDTSERGN